MKRKIVLLFACLSVGVLSAQEDMHDLANNIAFVAYYYVGLCVDFLFEFFVAYSFSIMAGGRSITYRSERIYAFITFNSFRLAFV